MKAQAKRKPEMVSRPHVYKITPRLRIRIDQAILKSEKNAEDFKKWLTSQLAMYEENAKAGVLIRQKELLKKQISDFGTGAFYIGLNQTLSSIKLKLYDEDFSHPLVRKAILHGYEVKLNLQIIEEFLSDLEKGSTKVKKEISSEYAFAAMEIYFQVISGVMPHWSKQDERNDQFFTRMRDQYKLKDTTTLEIAYNNYSNSHHHGSSIDPNRKAELIVLEKKWISNSLIHTCILNDLATIARQEKERKQKGSNNQ